MFMVNVLSLSLSQDVISLLRAGHLVGVAPGGGWEAQCGCAEDYGLMWKRREGFAVAAHEAGVPIIPVRN